MVLVVPADAVGARRWPRADARADRPTWLIGAVVDGRCRGRGGRGTREAAADGDRAARRGSRSESPAPGSNLRALAAAAERVSSVARSSSCSPIARVPRSTGRRSRGSTTALVPGAPRERRRRPGRGTRRSPRRSTRSVRDLVVLAGYMRILGAGRRSRRSPGRILNTHPSLLPVIPGRATRCATRSPPAWPSRGHGPPRRRDARRRARSCSRRPCRSWPATTRPRSGPASTPSSTGSCRGPSRSPRRGAARGRDAACTSTDALRRGRAAAAPPGAALGQRQDRPRRARPRARRARLRARLDRRDGPGAPGRRPAGHRRRGGHRVPRDARRPGEDAPSARSTAASSPIVALASHREPLVAAAIAPFELVVVNLYPFAAGRRATGDRPRRAGRGDRHRRAVDGPGRGQEPRRAWRSSPTRRATPTSSTRARAGRRGPGRPARPPSPSRRSATRRRTTRGSPRSCRAGWPPRASSSPTSRSAGLDATRTRRPSTIGLEKVATLRYGENPHQPARSLPAPRRPTRRAGRSRRRPPLQGKALSYNNVLDASAAAALARDLRGPAVRDRQAHEPVRRRRAARRSSRRGRRRWRATPCRRSAASWPSPARS